MTFDATTLTDVLSVLPRAKPSTAALFFRSVNYLYVRDSGAAVVDGTYAGLLGGRYNAPKSAPVCYLAKSQTSAAFEVEQEELLLGLGRSAEPAPRLTLGVTVLGAVLLDLTNPMIVRQLGLSTADLSVSSLKWKATNRTGAVVSTQQVGAVARASGYDGVLYPAVLSTYVSASLPGLANLALFMDPDASHRPANASVRVELHDYGLLNAPRGP